jgi:FixJ family two-component response regulator
MPECSGMDFFDQLQEAYSEKQIPFALMTGFSSNQEDFKHRNITILEKPISSTDLIPLFDQALFTQKNS